MQFVPFLRGELRRIARIIRGVDRDDPPSPTVRPLEYLRASYDPEVGKVLDAYLSVPESYRRRLPVEAICQAAGVSAWRILEVITVVAVRQGAQGSAIIVAAMHSRVVQKTVERALQDDGSQELMMLHKAFNFLPRRG